MIHVKVNGVGKATDKLNKIKEQLVEASKKGVMGAAIDTSKYVIKLAPGGQIKRCIKVELVNQKSDEVVCARVFNDTDMVMWSSYVEFGTGIYVDNEGIEDSIRLKRAKQIPWFVHISLVPPDFGKYGYVRIGDFWIVHGMRPRPYMKPAGFAKRKDNVKTVCKAISDMILEVCND